jgi:lysophospholipase L1-like esterase
VVLVRKAHPGSPLGLRSAAPAQKRVNTPRILFLGDSYTEGSGAAAGCNYPEVVERAFAERTGVPVQVMNAGVAGHGPRESAALLEYLIEQGYAFDAVVWNLFLENDFSDDLPGTQRRAVAGMPARLPASLFLRLFHPLDSHVFWWGTALVRLARRPEGAASALARGSAGCTLQAAAPQPPSPYLQHLVFRHLEANYASRGAQRADAVARDAVAAMRSRSTALGLPFVIVSFPDRILADGALRERLGVDLRDPRYDLAPVRRFLADLASDGPVIDLETALAAEPGLYRGDDTHLSDLGNLRMGERVAARLVELLPAQEWVRGRAPAADSDSIATAQANQ